MVGWALTPLVALCVPSDTLVEACHRAHLGVKVEAGSNLTVDHSHSHQADILVPNWSVGKPMAFDLSATSLLNLNILLEAGLTASAAARGTELRKHEVNDGKCWELWLVCVPHAYGC